MEIEEEVIFHTKADQVKFITHTNGDTVHLKNLTLSQAQATSLAWLVNADDNVQLEFQVKVKET